MYVHYTYIHTYVDSLVLVLPQLETSRDDWKSAIFYLIVSRGVEGIRRQRVNARKYTYVGIIAVKVIDKV